MKTATEHKADIDDTNYRIATREDVSEILAFIRELAEYEKLSHEVVATEDVLLETLFGPKPYAECLIAEVDGLPAGFAIFFHNYSTFLGKPGIYLEDLFVRPDYRSRGLGLGLFRAMAQIAMERDCGRMEWSVLDWNELAITFYKKLGAVPKDEWTMNSLARPAIEALAKS